MKNILIGLSLTAAAAFAQPSIADGGILNIASYANAQLPNGGIAQGSMFAVFGTNMGPSSLVSVQALPLTAELSGTRIRVTSGGQTVDCLMIYTSAGQLAGILPSNTPVSNAATMQVTYNGAVSAPRTFRIVARSLGIFALSQRGIGPSIIQNASQTGQPVNNFTRSARPGEVQILWGTGLGPVSGNEAAGALPGNQAGLPVEVYVGGRRANVTYQGRSGCCAGIDQIVFTVPEGVTGCNVAVFVRTGDVTSNAGSMSIATNGGTCPEISSVNLNELPVINGTTAIRTGSILLSRLRLNLSIPGVPLAINITTDIGFGSFELYDLTSYFGSSSSVQGAAPGNCQTFSTTSSNPTIPNGAVFTALDAGTPITVAGPRGSRPMNRDAMSRSYSGTFTDSSNPLAPGPGFLDAGAYTITAPGATGPNTVGSFTANLTIPADLNWTNQAQVNTINRSQGQPITWTGGDPNGLVTMLGFSSLTSAENSIGGAFICYERASAGNFTIPAYVLQTLPATPAASGGITGLPGGLLFVGASTNPVRFQATGLDYGIAAATTQTGKGVNYQ